MRDSLCFKKLDIKNAKKHAISFKYFLEKGTFATFHSFSSILNHSSPSRSEAEALSRELNMRLYRTSVKDDLNVSVVFQHLAENYVNKVGWVSGNILF